MVRAATKASKAVICAKEKKEIKEGGRPMPPRQDLERFYRK
jgi:hypothetical protein